MKTKTRFILLFLLFSGGLFAQSYSLNFDGQNDYVDLGNQLNFESINAFSIEAWIKIDNIGLQQIIAKLDGSLRGWGLQVNQGRLNAYLISEFGTNNIFVEGTTQLDDGRWHHVAMTYTGASIFLTEIRLYVDGQQEFTGSTGSFFVGSIANDGPATIGAYNSSGTPNEVWSGNIDNLKVWDHERNINQIRASKNDCGISDEEGLLAAYDFEDGINSNVLTDLSSNGIDGTLVNMDPATDWEDGHVRSSVQLRSGCQSYTWIDGITYTNTTNMATYPLSTPSGCDSVILLDLTILNVDTNVFLDSNTLSAGPTVDLYQWVDCANDFAPISGAVLQTFTPSESGEYAAIVAINGCVDTTSCIPVLITNTTSPEIFQGVQVFPNPSRGAVQIDLGNLNDVSLRVINALGRTIRVIPNINTSRYQLTLNEPPGLYLLELSHQGKKRIYKILRE